MLKKILMENEDLLVVNKPASIPCYRCGMYKHNSLLDLIKLNYPKYESLKLSPVHRLDRAVSGVILLAKSSHFAAEFEKKLKNNQVRKYYLARVVGQLERFVHTFCTYISAFFLT